MQTSASFLRASAGALLALSAGVLFANNIAIHGSVSATASYSDKFNYLGSTRKTLDVNSVEAVVNGVHRFDNGLRVGAQLYGYKIGGFSELQLDWANADYAFSNAFGIRLGRNKAPLGLYNDVQDVDAVRTFAYLPLAFYPKSYRPLSAYVDGLIPYGSLSAGRLGSFDYQVYYGTRQPAKNNTMLVRGSDNISLTEAWETKDPVYGGTWFWNLPLEGLKLGYSFMVAPKNELRGVLGRSEALRPEYLLLPDTVNRVFGAGTWNNSGRFAGTRADITGIRNVVRVASAEYTRDRWVFAAEYKLQDLSRGISTIPALAQLGLPTATAFTARIEEYYGMATYQATKAANVGLYYAYENRSRNTPGSNNDPTQRTRDWAAALSYAVTSAWLVKAEVHLLDGRSFLNNAGDDNRTSSPGARWTYFVLKTTYSF